VRGSVKAGSVKALKELAVYAFYFVRLQDTQDLGRLPLQVYVLNALHRQDIR
jgi:hypothetical protein